MRDKKKHVQSMHNYKITHLPDGRWQTHYRPPDKSERILVRTSTEELLYERLYDLYANKENLENLTLDSLFYEWLDYKSCITESKNTIKRHRQHYQRYFQGSSLFSQKIGSVTKIDLNSFCNRLVKDNHMTKKEWTNVKTILKGMFEYAEDKEYIDKNPLARINITVKFRQVDRKYGKTETFNTEEVYALNEYLDTVYEKTGDIAMLAVRSNMMMGLRVGELVALKWKDVTDEKHLHICREEVRDQETGRYSVVHHTKTRQDRYIIIVPQVHDILAMIRSVNAPQSEEDFVFMRDGKRLTSRQINYVLEKYAERTGAVKKSSHKLRKTYASVLQARGVPLDEIRKQLGHSDLQTTMAYVFNPLTEDETFSKIAGAFVT